MDILKLLLSSVLSVAALFLMTKLTGHRQISQLDFFDYVNGITIGSIAAELATELEEPHKPLTALIIYGILSVMINTASSKLPRARKYINGAPTVLFDSGKLYRENLKKAKLDLSEFLLMCREMGYFDLDEIQTAIFEVNGKLSVLPHAAFRPVTPTDMKIPVKASHIGVELILDGRIMHENLKRTGKGLDWLSYSLAQNGYSDAKEIFLGVYYAEEQKLSLYENIQINARP